MSEMGAGVGAFDAGLLADGDPVISDAARRAEAVVALEGARRKLRKQEEFRDAAEAEVERLEALISELDGRKQEVNGDGVVGE